MVKDGQDNHLYCKTFSIFADTIEKKLIEKDLDVSLYQMFRSRSVREERARHHHESILHKNVGSTREEYPSVDGLLDLDKLIIEEDEL
mmetsp:Transcript_41294/g.96837  ORF Transcript_41294/g.96837 Transcript_41294/m.96837 type:complete len:88 (+) Transcript_41294:3895-4158(+)